MSASLPGGPGGSGGPNGQRPTPPGSKGPPPRRRPQGGNPLVARRKPHVRPPGIHAPGTPLQALNAGKSQGAPVAKAQQKNGASTEPNFDSIRRQNGGWSFPAPPDVREYPLVLTKKALRDGLRFHVMRFAPPHQQQQSQGHASMDQNPSTRQIIDPTDQDQFTRPVTLHRRDPRQPPPGREPKEVLEEPTPEQNEESERLAQIKADREAQRAIDDAQKAPIIRDAPKKVNSKLDKRKQGTQVSQGPKTEKQKKESGIRYEEALPWHLEDADGKNVWVGQYEAPLSEVKVGLVIHESGFRMIPLEKWYKFSSKRTAVNALTIEEAEKAMSRKAPVGRWAARDEAREKDEKLRLESRTIINGRTNVKQESSTYKNSSRREKEDHDDIDMSGDEFQDDDEAPGYEQEDEESKDSKDRVRREQLQANVFNQADEKDVDKNEETERQEERMRKLLGKELKKALLKRDKQFQYDSDDSERERDPFASSSDSDSESDEDVKKEEDKDAKDKPEGSLSKGTNTPQGKKAATAEAAKKGKSLKRPGSPLVSDSSGTESTRNKKKKTGHSTSSLVGSRSTTPLPGSQVRRPGAGSTSDGEATAGEMSDGAGPKKKKNRNHLGTGTGGNGTPAGGSRAGSPAPAAGNLSPNPFARANSASLGTVTEKEIMDKLPVEEGITVLKFLGLFKGRVGDGEGQMSQKDWIKLVKQCADYRNINDKKLLFRKS